MGMRLIGHAMKAKRNQLYIDTYPKAVIDMT